MNAYHNKVLLAPLIKKNRLVYISMYKLVAVVIGVFFTINPGIAYSEEQRCNELGANCICAESLDTNAFTVANSFFLNPDNSTVKECSLELQNAVVSAVPASKVIVGNDVSVLNAMPPAHTVSNYLRGIDGHTGIFYVGHNMDFTGVSQYIKRTSMRFYVYHSPDYEFKGEGACENSKFGGLGRPNTGVVMDNSDGTLHLYAVDQFTYANGTKTGMDCCLAGPPTTLGANIGKNNWRGNWWRVEGVTINRNGGSSPNGVVYKMYIKNITTGGEEFKVIDTSIYDANAKPDNGWLGADDLTPPGIIKIFSANIYRQGACNGYRAISHLMVAGWDTDEGQRIGSAFEVEGVSGEAGSLRPKSFQININ